MGCCSALRVYAAGPHRLRLTKVEDQLVKLEGTLQLVTEVGVEAMSRTRRLDTLIDRRLGAVTVIP